MEAFIADGRIVSIVLAIVAVELLVLLTWSRRTGRGFPPATLLLKLAPGVCLVLALGAALRGGDAGWIALWLTAAGVTHALDLWRSWPR